MALADYGLLPSTAKTTAITPFSINVPDEDIKLFKDLLKLSPIANTNYENSRPVGERNLGLRREWLIEAKRAWEKDFDWRKHETQLNSFPHFKATIDDKLGNFSVHFVALFSKKKDAIPIFALHGWPGNFSEFLQIVDLLRSRYSPDTLPYHIIVPSLPGYTFSSPPPKDDNFCLSDVARIINELANTLGFGEGYVAQGGDVGSRVARLLGATYEGCKAVHLNYSPMSEPEGFEGELDEIEKQGLERWAWFKGEGSAYAVEQATRPSTLAFALASNPLALLAWIGEKFLDWTDEDPPLDEILLSVSLYWFTGCMSTNFYSYRESYGPSADKKGNDHPERYIGKPFGFSWFPKEIVPIPKAWIATTGDLVFFRRHEKGGHFAAMEQPEVLLKDVEDFLAQVW